MFYRLIQTRCDYAAVALRVGLGVVFFAHGAQKMLGWFGGAGFDKTFHGFVHSGIPAVFAFLAIVAEFFGSLGVLSGFLTRIAAFGIGCVMAVAVARVHLPNGFFMNWAGKQHGEGFEFHLLAVAIVIALIVRGGGALSVDYALSHRGRTPRRDSGAPVSQSGRAR